MSAQKKEWLARKAAEKKIRDEELQKLAEEQAAQVVPDITVKIGATPNAEPIVDAAAAPAINPT